MTIKRIPADPQLAPPLDGAAAAVPTAEPGRRAQAARARRHRTLNAEDGTAQLLLSGFWTLVVGSFAALLTLTVFGGIGPQGPHTNPGWLALIVCMMCTPFAVLLLLLGGAKWLRNLRLARLPSR